MKTNKIQHRIVLTGASGTLGGNFLRAVTARDDVSVLAFVRPDSRDLATAPGVEVVALDDLDRMRVGVLVGRFQPTCLVHCAATGMDFPRPRWFDLIRFNVDTTVTLCECVSAIPGCHLIYVSTGLAYRPLDRPLREDDALDTQHPYGASKAAADLLVRAAAAEFGVPLTVLRPFSFTGRGDDRTRLFAQILRAAEVGEPARLTAGTQVRDHCSARDIAQGIVAAMERPPSASPGANVFNLGSGSTESIRAMVERVAGEIALPAKLEYGAQTRGRFDPPQLVADISRAKKELGWQPRHNLAHAVWELARDSFPKLKLREPAEFLS